MDDSDLKSVEEIRLFLESTAPIRFKGANRLSKYNWIEETLKRLKYYSLTKKDKGIVRRYIMRMTGFSRAQVSRLIKKNLMYDEIKPEFNGRRGFQVVYTNLDKELLAETDNAHSRLSGPATNHILERQYYIYGDKRFERLKDISPAHIYNIRQSHTYKTHSNTIARTKSVCVPIGIRRKPEPNGIPGYLRVDTVHQGEQGKKQGIYHINLVDEVTQWEIITCVEAISEDFLSIALETAIDSFPFKILNFHSDNGSEFINKTVADILNRLLIKQTKSRANRTNDNALVESKNGSVVRKHMGYWYIDQKYADDVNTFYSQYLNHYLNFHRPCGFATITIDDCGKRKRKYEVYQTPYEKLKSIKDASKYLKSGLNFNILDNIAMKHSDNEFAKMMQEAKDTLFANILDENWLKYYKGGK